MELLGNDIHLSLSIPYIAVELTKEQYELIKNKQPTLYEVDGKTLFPVKDEHEGFTGKNMIFILFK